MAVISENSPPLQSALYHAQEALRVLCEESYYKFFISAWSILEPETPLLDSWHIRYLCDTLQAEIERIAKREPKTYDLLINEPPRSGKSLIATVCLCPWAWTRFPHLRFINVSYSERLAVDHCLASRRIVESTWYQRLWGNRVVITSDQNQKAYFENSARGFRRACPIRSVTGSGADVMVWDDPQNPEMAESDVERENTKRVFGGTGYSRLNDQKIGLRVIIQQRLHEDDLTGYLLANSRNMYRHICLPVELTNDVSPPEVQQYYRDGLLFPERFGWSQLAEAKLPTALGPYGYAAQMLQSPAPPEGGTFKRYWWRFWVPKGKKLPAPAYRDTEGKLCTAIVVELPEKFDTVINSWDTAIEGGHSHDYWAGGVWARVGANKFLLHQIREQMNYPEARKAVKALYAFWPNTGALLIEKASNGPAVKADLQQEIPGIITIPTGRLSKEDRVRYSDTVPYAAQVEAGNIYLPHPAIAPWVEEFITEHAKFPKATHDDQVDQAAQAVNYLSQVRYMWSYYQPFNPAHHRKFDVRWTNALHYGAMYLGKDMSISLLAALWDIVERKLYIYGCLLANQWSARGLAIQMVRGMHLTEQPCLNIYGNNAMFKADRRTISQLVSTEITAELRRQGHKRTISIIEPINYDRAGAIALANVLFSQNSIVVHEAAQEANRQFAAWHIENGAPADGYGLCEALTLLVSELNRNARLKPPPPQPPDRYKPLKVAPTQPTVIEQIEAHSSWQAT